MREGQGVVFVRGVQSTAAAKDAPEAQGRRRPENPGRPASEDCRRRRAIGRGDDHDRGLRLRQGVARPLYEMYTERELYDTVLIVGDQSVAAHRVVLAIVSPYLRKMFGSGMAKDTRYAGTQYSPRLQSRLN